MGLVASYSLRAETSHLMEKDSQGEQLGVIVSLLKKSPKQVSMQ